MVAPDIFMGVLTFTQGSVCLFHFFWQACSNLSLSALLLWVLRRVRKTKHLFPNSSLTTRQWYISINNICCPFQKTGTKGQQDQRVQKKADDWALRASPRDTADRSKDLTRCSRPCFYGCILLYIIPSEQKKLKQNRLRSKNAAPLLEV